MKSARLIVCLGLLLGTAASAASQLEAVRSAAADARGKVSSIRSQQMALRKELNEVAARIQALKAEGKGKPLLGRSELDAALRRSQELSGSLTGLAQSLSAAEADATQKNLALLSELSAELTRTRTEFDRTTDRTARSRLIAKLRSLRAEREQVRAALPPTAVPALEASRASDDPEDLLEQADALRDDEDKVRRELQALEARIREAREERELDRRLNAFLEEESIFDEQDRRLRLSRQTFEAREATPPANDVNMGAGPASAPAPGESTSPPADSNSRGVEGPSPMGSSNETTQVVTREASDARPTIGRGGSLAASGGDELEALEAERKRLLGLAQELEARARQLEQRARSLE